MSELTAGFIVYAIFAAIVAASFIIATGGI